MIRQIWRWESSSLGIEFTEEEPDKESLDAYCKHTDGVVEALVAVPLADLRSVIIVHPDRSSNVDALRFGVELNRFGASNHWIVRETLGIRHLKTTGKWTFWSEENTFARWPDFGEALAAARAAVDRAKKESGG